MKYLQEQLDSRQKLVTTQKHALHTQQKITLVACFCSADTLDNIIHQLGKRHILCDAHPMTDFYASKDLRAIRNSVSQSGYLWMIDTHTTGKNVFSLLEKLTEEEAIRYYLRMPPHIILPTHTTDQLRHEVDRICYESLLELNTIS